MNTLDGCYRENDGLSDQKRKEEKVENGACLGWNKQIVTSNEMTFKVIVGLLGNP